jgi:hypothetical protein
MGIPLIIIGLILMLAGASWFTGAATVGVILFVAGIVITAIQVGIVLAAWSKLR